MVGRVPATTRTRKNAAMSLTSRATNILVDKMNTSFAKIGTSNATVMPPSKRNDEGIVWELFVAYHLDRLSGKRKKLALAACGDAGMLPNEETRPVESTRVLYHGEHVMLTLKQVRRSGRLDPGALYELLMKKGVKQDVLDSCWAQAMGPDNIQHLYDGVPIIQD